jgi:predicted NBD/HSP70 family sugar kinase
VSSAIDGRVHQGHDGTAGEIGHQTIDPDGPWCGCGNRGCLESFARADQIAAACGTATAEEAVRAAQAGDERAAAGLAEIGRYLGIGIANMISVISPDRIVLGGGVAAAGELLLGPIRAEIARRVRTTPSTRSPWSPPSWASWRARSGPRCTAPNGRPIDRASAGAAGADRASAPDPRPGPYLPATARSSRRSGRIAALRPGDPLSTPPCHSSGSAG